VGPLKGIFCFSALALFLFSEATLLAADPEPYIRWEYKPPPRHRNGMAGIHLFLASSDGSPITEAFWYYRLINLEDFREIDFQAPPTIVTVFFTPGENELIIDSGAVVLVEVMGTGLLHGTRSYAQTASLLFGESKGFKPVTSNGPEPSWPSFQLIRSGETYWPQTGQSFTMVPAPGFAIGEFAAYEQTGVAKGEFVIGHNGRSFIPASDPQLNAQGSAASKPVYFVAPLEGGGSLSYTIYVHRNRYGGEDINLGLLVFFTGFIATGLVLGRLFYKRRALRHAAQGI
jgi:hypothetical protein